ncbi:MAG: flagellar export protein FliJ [Magnetococcales bacterium]|nr:flagellar export protein FliJ [Magnetococcales bacterium]
MGRFSRLVELRKIREEADGLAYAHVLSRIEGFRQKIRELNIETEEGRRMSCDMVGQQGVFGTYRFDDFFRGQTWRVQKLQEKITLAQQQANAAKKIWLASRTQLQQAEKMAEKEEAQRKKEQRLKDNKELDMIGIFQSQIHT